MALVVFLFAFGALCSQGSTAVTPVFVKLGDDVLLEVKKPVVLTEEEDFFWKFNTSYSIVKLPYESKKIIYKKYSQRAELSDQNHSLLLKNLTQADSGRYVALVTSAKDRIIAEYKVIVQNPVSPVNLSVDSVSNSTESCNLTVTCSTQDPNISSTFRCDTQTCNQMEGEQPEVSTSGSSLHVYLLNDSIICNHSNEVSWEEDMKEIWDFCPLNAVSDPGQIIAIGIGIAVFLCLLICGLSIICQQKRKKTCKITCDVPQNINPAQRPNQNATEDASGLSPQSTYALVEFPTRPTGSNETNTLPETIYAQVNKAPKSTHHPELKNTNNVYSQDLITVCHDVF
ncbi:uncharacterized protein LOC121909484 isoform X2 [Thunnus maccoyii]|uniref:uncharacterized protein LOC121909484 isoform X2 n=1 Tax=Thunnus maccoyii TaxID=8240 RepID=UPI001C4C2866|nr:uncharacterized protein LOC121909484 isoform X2 [Thunnus maccoyii]